MKNKLIKEALGVREELFNAAKLIYSEIIQKLNLIGLHKNVTELENSVLRLDLKSNINYLQKIDVYFDIKYHDKDTIDIIGLVARMSTSLKNDRVHYSTSDTANLVIELESNRSKEIDDVVKNLQTNSNLYVPSIAHELKHFFDNTTERSNNLKRRLKYKAYLDLSNNSNTITQIVADAWYRTSIDELLVIPTEIYSELKYMNITKKNFLDALKNSKYIVIYKDYIDNLYYDKIYNTTLKQVLESFEEDPQTKYQVFERSKKYVDQGISNNYTLALFLTELLFYRTRASFYDEIRNGIIRKYEPLDPIRDIAFMLGMISRRDITDPKALLLYNKMSKNNYYAEPEFSFKDSPTRNEIFFEREFKKIRRKSANILKKIYKIYSLLPNRIPPRVSGSYKKKG
jgi:hypothetical protein